MSRYADNSRSIILISDGLTGDFDSNSHSRFINRLPVDLDCQTTEFEMALTRIKFVNAIYNLPESEEHIFRLTTLDLTELDVRVPPGYYPVKDILLYVNSKLDNVKMGINESSQKVTINNSDVNDLKIELSNTLSNILGFESESILSISAGGEVTAPFICNPHPNDQLYVYSSMLSAEHIVGGGLTNLLCICPIKSNTFNETVVYEPNNLTFLPIKRQHFLYSTIYICNHLGHEVSFERGPLEVHLRLRRVSPFL